MRKELGSAAAGGSSSGLRDVLESYTIAITKGQKNWVLSWFRSVGVQSFTSSLCSSGRQGSRLQQTLLLDVMGECKTRALQATTIAWQMQRSTTIVYSSGQCAIVAEEEKVN